MKTIHIDKQEGGVAVLANALTTALATAIGWTAEKNADGNLTGNVKKSGINIYFRVYTSGSNAMISLSNGYVTASIASSTQYVTYNTNETYKLYVFESSGGSIAVGASQSSGNIRLWALITRNSAGEYVGGITSSLSGRLNTVRGNETVTRNINLSVNNDAPYTSIVKLPDIWGAAMFNELYYVMSCPYKNTNRVFTINGKNYRSIGQNSEYMVLALPGT